MLDEPSLRQLLDQVARGERPVDEALASLRRLPFERVDGFACVDQHRALRQGFAEVVFCQGKTPQQVAAIMSRLVEQSAQALGTRADDAHYQAVRQALPEAQYDPQARCVWIDREPDRPRLDGVVVAAAGTTDLPVAEEAALTLDLMGHAPQRVYDVGVAGLHRLLGHLPLLQEANVVVVAAGMEGALPSVIGGLISAPVIAVPTSVGYGASFNGLAALLGMLNTCSPGVSVVNIDNGFGAGFMAGAINRKIAGPSATGAGSLTTRRSAAEEEEGDPQISQMRQIRRPGRHFPSV